MLSWLPLTRCVGNCGGGGSSCIDDSRDYYALDDEVEKEEEDEEEELARIRVSCTDDVYVVKQEDVIAAGDD